MIIALAVLIILSMLGGGASGQNLFDPAPISGGKPLVEDGSGMKNDCILAAARTFAAIPGAKIVGSVTGPAVNEGNPNKLADIWGMEIGIHYEAAGVSGHMFFRCEWWEGSRPFITREARPRTIPEDF